MGFFPTFKLHLDCRIQISNDTRFCDEGCRIKNTTRGWIFVLNIIINFKGRSQFDGGRLHHRLYGTWRSSAFPRAHIQQWISNKSLIRQSIYLVQLDGSLPQIRNMKKCTFQKIQKLKIFKSINSSRMWNTTSCKWRWKIFLSI